MGKLLFLLILFTFSVFFLFHSTGDIQTGNLQDNHKPLLDKQDRMSAQNNLAGRILNQEKQNQINSQRDLIIFENYIKNLFKNTPLAKKFSSEQKVKEFKEFKLREQFRPHTPRIVKELDRYYFKNSIQEMIETSSWYKKYEDPSWDKDGTYGVKQPQFIRAIKLLQVTTNVNFKGQIVLDGVGSYDTPQNKYQSIKNLLQEERQYYQSKYQIQSYKNKQIRFCITVSSFNNAKSLLYLRNLDSIFQQDYKNYHLVYINDASTDGTGDFVYHYMEVNNIPSDKYRIIHNQINQEMTINIYNAANHYCNLGQVMILIDGDDALLGRQVLSLLNAYYQKHKPALVYTQNLMLWYNHIAHSFNIPIDQKVLEERTWRSMKRFVTSHLKSMYVDLFRMIKQQDLKFQNGEWIRQASDCAYMTPLIELAGKRMNFLPEMTYQYRHDSEQHKPHQTWQQAANYVYSKKPYEALSQFPFADNPKLFQY